MPTHVQYLDYSQKPSHLYIYKLADKTYNRNVITVRPHLSLPPREQLASLLEIAPNLR